MPESEFPVQTPLRSVAASAEGDCHIVLQLLRKVPGYVLVYEPDPAIFQEVRQSPLFAKFRDEQKLYILYGGEDQWIPLRDVITDILNDDCVETTAVTSMPCFSKMILTDLWSYPNTLMPVRFLIISCLVLLETR